MKIEQYGYKKWTKTPNTIVKGGSVYTKFINVDVNNVDKKRLIRIYLPSTYDFSNPNKRFPVLYMMDGKNLFDDHTSFVGEWGVDEAIEDAISKGKSEGIIVVGIDSAKGGDDRAEEMTPPEAILRKRVNPNGAKGYANILGDYMFKELKKEIDSLFFTLPDKNHTAVGGSSMGGLMAYYLYHTYKEYVGYSISFSPAFFLYKRSSLLEDLRNNITSNKELGKIYFYVGGVGFEHLFIKSTEIAYNHFVKVGFNNDEVTYVFDPTKEHNEQAWRIYFPDALEYFNYFNN